MLSRLVNYMRDTLVCNTGLMPLHPNPMDLVCVNSKQLAMRTALTWLLLMTSEGIVQTEPSHRIQQFCKHPLACSGCIASACQIEKD